MNKRGFVMIFAVVLFVLLFPCLAGAEDLPEFDDNSVIVVTKPEYSRIRLSGTGGYEETLARLGITDTKVLMNLTGNTENISLLSDTGGSIVKLTLPEAGEDKVLEAVDALNASGTVKYAEPNYYYYLDSVPDDPYYVGEDLTKNYQFGIVDAEAVWSIGIDCSNVTVAVLDSGIFAEHEDLKDNIWTNPGEIPDDGEDNDENGYKDDVHGWDFTGSGDNDPDDGYNPECEMQGHGTHVSGIISAATGNGKGIASLAGNISTGSAKIVPLKIFYDSGSKKVTSVDMIVDAINYVKEMKIPIANCSWSGGGSEPLKEAIQSCTDTLFIAAAGNSNRNNDSVSTSAYPAKYDLENIISVGASTANDTLASFSNYGNSVDIAAPGYNIWSTGNTDLKTDSYKFLSGTSQATPLVASAAAVIKGKYPSFTPAEIKECIINGAVSVETLTYSGCRINGNRRLSAGGALRWAESYVLTDILDISASVTDENNIAFEKGASPERITAHIDFPDSVGELSEEYVSSLEPFTLILAAYDENGTLAGIAEKTVSPAEMLGTVTLSADLNNAVYSAKIYIWKTIGSMIPLRNAKDVL